MKATIRQTLQIYWDHVRPYKWMFFGLLLCITGAIVVSLLIPIYLKEFFDLLASNPEPSADIAKQLIAILISILGVELIAWAFYRISGMLQLLFETKAVRDMFNSNFEYLHNHSHRFFINKFVGSLVRQANRLVGSFEDIMDRFLWDMVPLAVRVVTVLVVLTILGKGGIALAMLIWTIIYLTINYYYSLYKLKYDTQRANTNSEVTARLADSISNNNTIKLFAALPHEHKEYKKLTHKQFKISRLSWRLGEYSIIIQSALMIMLNFGVLYLAVRGWQAGVITVGDFALIQAYLIQLFNHLWGFGRVIRRLYEKFADAEEMTEILNTPHEITDAPKAKKLTVPKGEITFDNVTFAYNKTRSVINNLNLTLNPGEKVGLVGASGAGKSTLVSLLFRYFDVTGGHIYVDGQDIAQVTQNSLRENISLVPQDPILFHRSLKENISYGKRNATLEEAIAAAKLANCHDFINSLTEKYNTYVGERGVKLSGGERQRVAIARAILKNAPILVLDEATSSLDSESELMIQDALKNLMQDKTVLVIAHRLSTLLQMDRIIVVQDGAIVEEGTHAELSQKPNGVYKHLWELQAGGFLNE